MARRKNDFKLSPEQQQMVIDNQNLARREAWRVQRTTGIEYSILESVAFMGLCKACYRFDPDAGFKFSSLATPTIYGELLHYIRDKTYALRLTHRMREQWCKGRKLLFKGFSDQEIADSLEIPLTDWQETRSTCSGPPLELKDQAKPVAGPEASEVDLGADYFERAIDQLFSLSVADVERLKKFFTTGRGGPPHETIKKLLKGYNF
jgi:DNA-directed RNA polymerase specialized sigma subunit